MVLGLDKLLRVKSSDCGPPVTRGYSVLVDLPLPTGVSTKENWMKFSKQLSHLETGGSLYPSKYSEDDRRRPASQANRGRFHGPVSPLCTSVKTVESSSKVVKVDRWWRPRGGLQLLDNMKWMSDHSRWPPKEKLSGMMD